MTSPIAIRVPPPPCSGASGFRSPSRPRDAHLGRDRRRGRAQRPGLRRLPRAGGPPGAGAGSAGPGGRGLHAGGALAGRPDVPLRLRRGAAASAGHAGAATRRSTASAGPRPRAACSCRSRTAPASSSGATRRAARRRSRRLAPRRSRGLARAPGASSGGCARRSGRTVPEDLWIGPAPTREAIERRVGGDRGRARACSSTGRWSSWSERYLDDERLHLALPGPGRHRHQRQPARPGDRVGLLPSRLGSDGGDGRAPGVTSWAAWGWCRSSSATSPASSARRWPPACRSRGSCRARASSWPRASGSGRRSSSPTPTRPRRWRCSTAVPIPAGPRRSPRIPMKGVTVKVNMTLTELPDFRARPGTREPHHTGQANTPLSKDEWRDAPPGRQRRDAAAAHLERALPPDRVRPERGAGRACRR